MNEETARQVIEKVVSVEGRTRHLTVNDLQVKNNRAIAIVQTDKSIITILNWFQAAGAKNVSMVTEGLTRINSVSFGV